MQGHVASWLFGQSSKVASVLSNAVMVTFRPSAFAERIAIGDRESVHHAINFFLGCVASAIALEAAFSFVFNTSFSDWVHYFFPVFVAVTGLFSIYAFMKVLWTRPLSFTDLTHCALYVFGAAILFTVAVSLAIIAIDFYVHNDIIAAKECRYRTIMCLLSPERPAQEGYEYGYEYGYALGPDWTLGFSLTFVYPFLAVAAFVYITALSKLLEAKLNVARWRTFAASLLSLILLVPGYFKAINFIYALLYAT